jgi:hypothetical protein
MHGSYIAALLRSSFEKQWQENPQNRQSFHTTLNHALHMEKSSSLIIYYIWTHGVQGNSLTQLVKDLKN